MEPSWLKEADALQLDEAFLRVSSSVPGEQLSLYQLSEDCYKVGGTVIAVITRVGWGGGGAEKDDRDPFIFRSWICLGFCSSARSGPMRAVVV